MPSRDDAVSSPYDVVSSRDDVAPSHHDAVPSRHAREFTLTVNGEQVTVNANEDTPLLNVLRDDLGLRGTRFGCGLGQCGACFVHVDGRAVSSCDTSLWSVESHEVVTVEGLRGQHPVQRALVEEQAGQCGFCLSGIVMSAAALLEANPRPDAETVAAALDRNLCRCGTQLRIIRAVVKAGEAS